MNAQTKPAGSAEEPVDEELVRSLREFSREYTRLIGALDYRHRLGTPHSLPEARVLYELAAGRRVPVAALRERLDMDAGQLSRLLSRAEARGLVGRESDPADSRRQLVGLSGAGREAARLLDRRAREATGALVRDLSAAERERLGAALRVVTLLLGLRRRPTGHLLRPPEPGELGWVIQRHGALYTAEYGWNAAFEALVADVVATFAREHDAAREAAWIAEWDGEPVGSILCVAEPDDAETARLRLLLVEPHARGLGIGGALVARCLDFARGVGYRRMVLWTNECLASARRLYQAAGFTLTDSAPHTLFGPRETGQTWSLDLTRPADGVRNAV
ncbi:bifunctional helix-turn-helix transcriptional regulator/GNAT family N-acetyltransferase [Streptomyces triticirhizae]|uniref:MarR family transcriptional regulator n=1 Tax=Streptomyces triticirhizae TaxID=2483353 RepID=A0A3M2LVZ2_9ACTN|nr:helix-turn-helix domain-containing GNAT family N-acetyltransferase [Streptomyces triticirhizae]RMI41651.1 MarR family transcriptional regulator [Streptomyces triticirhizae]